MFLILFRVYSFCRFVLSVQYSILLLSLIHISLRSSGYHYRIAACIIQHFFGVLGRKYISVSYNRYIDRFFNLFNYIPVGLSAVILFSRSSVDSNSGKADWEIIRRVKEAVKIPVIGNGDIFTPQDAKRMIEETGCDAIMAARGARGNPWLFRDIIDYLEKGILHEKPSLKEMTDMMLRHAEMHIRYKGEYQGIREMRKHVAWYTACLLYTSNSFIEQQEALYKTLAGHSGNDRVIIFCKVEKAIKKLPLYSMIQAVS